jgi:hypothetical protein
VKTWNDTTTLIHVQLAELVALETLRYHFPDTGKMITRKIVIRQRLADTNASASLQLLSSHSNENSQTTQTSPLTAQSKKKGQAPLCAAALYSCIVILTIFLCIIYNVRKK